MFAKFNGTFYFSRNPVATEVAPRGAVLFIFRIVKSFTLRNNFIVRPTRPRGLPTGVALIILPGMWATDGSC